MRERSGNGTIWASWAAYLFAFYITEILPCSGHFAQDEEAKAGASCEYIQCVTLMNASYSLLTLYFKQSRVTCLATKRYSSHPPTQPALSAYQRQLHHKIHGPKEPLPDSLTKRVKSGLIKPLKRTSTSPIPDLPQELLEKQKSLEGLRELSPPDSKRPHHPSSSLPPPYARSSTSPPRRTSPRRKTQGSSIVRKKSSTLLLNSDPNCVLTRYSPPLESLTDPLEIIERLKREPQLGFLYLTPVDSQKSVRYNPYNLRCVCRYLSICGIVTMQKNAEREVIKVW